VVRRFNGSGNHERTKAAAVAVGIGLDGRLVEPGPNNIFSIDCRRTIEGQLCLVWFYCPLDQQSAPAQFRIYRSSPAGPIDFENPLAIVPYEGRRFYCYRTDIPEEGRYQFAVKAVNTEGIESASPSLVTCQIQDLPPETPTILAAEPA
jgi:hypothetical protein